MRPIYKMINLKEFRSSAEGLPDLLNYAFQIDKGVMLNKDGSLTKTFSFFGKDANSSTASELDGISQKISRALNLLDNGWMINIDSIRRVSDKYPQNNHFQDAVSKMIDTERELQFSTRSAYFAHPPACSKPQRSHLCPAHEAHAPNNSNRP